MSISTYLPPVSVSRTAILLIGALLALSLVLTWTPQLDALADNYLNESIADAGVVYASARGLNAIISVIQSIEISISLGAGVAVNLGEVLDPLNDLIERFSALVLTGLVGLGIQKLVLVFSSSLFTKVITTAVLIGCWLVWLFRGELPNLLKKLLCVMILVRFAFAIEVGLSWALDQAYFDANQREALSTLDFAKNTLETVRDDYMSTIEDQGVFRGAWSAARNLVGTDDQESLTELTVGALVQLLVIMLVRSILLPVLFFWVMIHLFRRYLSV